MPDDDPNLLDVDVEATDNLTAMLLTAVLEPQLMIALDWDLWGGRPLIRLLGPGATERSKPRDLVGRVIVGDQGETHADMLRTLAGVLDQAGRS